MEIGVRGYEGICGEFVVEEGGGVREVGVGWFDY